MAFSSAGQGTYIHGSSSSSTVGGSSGHGSETTGMSAKEVSKLQMPALDIDLTSLLPLLVRQLLLGKGESPRAELSPHLPPMASSSSRDRSHALLDASCATRARQGLCREPGAEGAQRERLVGRGREGHHPPDAAREHATLH